MANICFEIPHQKKKKRKDREGKMEIKMAQGWLLLKLGGEFISSLLVLRRSVIILVYFCVSLEIS